MGDNSTLRMVPEVSTNVTSTSSAGLALGLTFSFVFVVVVATVIVYKHHSKIRNMVQFRQRRSQKKKENSETTQAESHLYTSMITEQSAGHAPIYENLPTQTTGYNRPVANQRRSPGDPEEDLYLQCDLPDDAIYSNDPKCHQDIIRSQEEDVYIVPDS